MWQPAICNVISLFHYFTILVRSCYLLVLGRLGLFGEQRRSLGSYAKNKLNVYQLLDRRELELGTDE